MNANYIDTENGLPFVSARLSIDHVVSTDKPLKKPEDVLNYMSHKLADSVREEGFALFCDAAIEPICIARIGLGNVTNCRLSARDVAQIGLLCNARYVYVIHNHPNCHNEKTLRGVACSGDDVKITLAIGQALELLDMTLADSIVCSSFSPKKGTHFPTYYSMRFQTLFTTLTTKCDIRENLEILARKTGDMKTYEAFIDDYSNVTSIDWKEFDEKKYWKSLIYPQGTDEEHDLEITL